MVGLNGLIFSSLNDSVILKIFFFVVVVSTGVSYLSLVENLGSR